MNKISDFIKETPERTLTPSIVQGHRRRQPFINQKAGTFFLDFPTSKTMWKKKCLLFLSHLIYSILLEPPEQTQPESQKKIWQWKQIGVMWPWSKDCGRSPEAEKRQKHRFFPNNLQILFWFYLIVVKSKIDFWLLISRIVR